MLFIVVHALKSGALFFFHIKVSFQAFLFKAKFCRETQIVRMCGHPRPETLEEVS